MPDISRVDRQILGVLQTDAAISTADLAEQVHMSQSPCWRRINRLQESGVILKKSKLRKIFLDFFFIFEKYEK